MLYNRYQGYEKNNDQRNAIYGCKTKVKKCFLKCFMNYYRFYI